MVMTHGDDKGLVFPPLVAPVQVVVIPVPFNGVDTKGIYQACEAVKSTLLKAGIRAKTDNRDNYACGWKYSDWEQKGVPLRIEIGPRDVARNQVSFWQLGLVIPFCWLMVFFLLPRPSR